MGVFTDIIEKHGVKQEPQSGTLFGSTVTSYYERKRERLERQKRIVSGVYSGIPDSATSKLLGHDLYEGLEPTELVELYNESQKTDEDRRRELDQSSGILQDTEPRDGAEIRAAEPKLRDRIRSKLPEPLQEKVFDPLVEGLFGQGEFTDDKGLVGFVAPALAKTDEEKVMERYDNLKLAGVNDERAMELAKQHLALGRFGDLEGVSAEEKAALDDIRFWENVDIAFLGIDVATLGRGKVARKAAREALSKTDEAIEFITRSLGDGSKAPVKRLSTYTRLRKTIDDQWVRLREFVEDDWIRVRRLQEGAVVEEGADPYTAEILSSGRTSSQIERGREVGQQILDDITEVGIKTSAGDNVILEAVNKYLVALHAGERIRAVGDNALPFTKAQADEFLEGLKQTEMYDDVKRIANQVKALHDETLDILRDGGVITKDLHSQLRGKYKHHVPLQRIFEETEDVGTALARRGTDVRTTGIKQAKGSQREIDDVIGNVIYNREQAVLRAEKNRVANEILNFVRNNPQMKNIFKVRRPKAVGESFADIAGDRTPIMERVSDPKTLQLYEDGKKMLIEIADERLALALRGVNRKQIGTLMRGISAFTRFMSGLATRFNPEFAFSNKIRDLQEAVIYAAANGQGAKASRVAARDPKSLTTVTEHIRKQGGLQGELSSDAQLYQQMIDDGGTTGGFALSTRKQLAMDFEKMRALARSSPRRAATKFLEYIDNWNKVFEDSSRFSVYKEALEQGMSRRQAARMAKESTINFNKMGTGGPIINGLYMFANAAIQGNVKMLRALRNPKVAGTVITTVGTSVFAVNEWNDKVDPDWRDKVSKWDRMNGLTIMIPTEEGGATWFTIPVSWGLKPIKVATDELYDLSTGYEDSVGDSMGRTLAALLESYNPIGGTDIGQIMTPTIADIPMDIIRNNAWYGGKIAPDWDRNAPDSTRYFDDLRDTATGRTMVRISAGLSGRGIEVSPENLNYGFEQLIGGAGRFANKVLNTIRGIGTEDELETKNMPFVGRFLRTRTEQEIGSGSQKAEDIRGILSEQSRANFYFNQRAEDIYQQMKNADNPAEEFNELKAVDPEIAKKVLQIKRQDELNLTYTDRLILDLGVRNGERAKYIHQEMKEAENDEQRDQIWNEYVRKKIVTKEVAKQVKYLFSQD